MTRHGPFRPALLLLLGVLLLPALGCKKGSTQLKDVRDGNTVAGGLGLDMGQQPAPKPGAQPKPQPTPQPQPNPQTTPAPIDRTENFRMPRPDLLVASRHNLDQIGKAYLAAATLNMGPVNSEKDLGIPPKMLVDPVRRPYMICYGVDISNLPGETLLAWESGPDTSYHRAPFGRTEL